MALLGSSSGEWVADFLYLYNNKAVIGHKLIKSVRLFVSGGAPGLAWEIVDYNELLAEKIRSQLKGPGLEQICPRTSDNSMEKSTKSAYGRQMNPGRGNGLVYPGSPPPYSLLPSPGHVASSPGQQGYSAPSRPTTNAGQAYPPTYPSKPPHNRRKKDKTSNEYGFFNTVRDWFHGNDNQVYPIGDTYELPDQISGGGQSMDEHGHGWSGGYSGGFGGDFGGGGGGRSCGVKPVPSLVFEQADVVAACVVNGEASVSAYVSLGGA